MPWAGVTVVHVTLGDWRAGKKQNIQETFQNRPQHQKKMRKVDIKTKRSLYVFTRSQEGLLLVAARTQKVTDVIIAPTCCGFVHQETIWRGPRGLRPRGLLTKIS